MFEKLGDVLMLAHYIQYALAWIMIGSVSLVFVCLLLVVLTGNRWWLFWLHSIVG